MASTEPADTRQGNTTFRFTKYTFTPVKSWRTGLHLGPATLSLSLWSFHKTLTHSQH